MDYPENYEFETVNDFVFDSDRHFEELQNVCIGAAGMVTDQKKEIVKLQEDNKRLVAENVVLRSALKVAADQLRCVTLTTKDGILPNRYSIEFDALLNHNTSKQTALVQEVLDAASEVPDTTHTSSREVFNWVRKVERSVRKMKESL